MLNICLQQSEVPTSNPTVKLIFIILCFAVLAVFVLSRFFNFLERLYAIKYKKPFFLNLILQPKKLTSSQLELLEREFIFYNKLKAREKRVFRHRLATFMQSKQFVGRDGLELTEDMLTLISATAVMLTFGFRKYLIPIIETVIIYPKAYFSQINEVYHKGEINPQLKIIVFSWKDFEKGYHIGDDNLNLGIHEFGHAMHLNAARHNDISSLIFNEGFKQLTTYLQQNEALRLHLIQSKYFRAYAFTNPYEFFAVLLENFIETPADFKSEYPKIYGYIKQMLNLNVAGY
ncbi:MAG: hypothetical protein HKN40_13440 [Winogradskyella sp.]|uniref:zinc-dependent peptidase n=1 Tax=Winogradskyella sp. TaxID=1883156 RepID=UPI0017B4CB8B|nr:hypothetical protein [Winogradskyella sp.]